MTAARRDDASGDVPSLSTGASDSREREQLVQNHLDLAQQLARRFVHRGESLDDLVQVACLALIGAADRFDPSLGFEFSTFATRTIIGELKRHLRDNVWAVRPPRQLQELYLQINEVVVELTQRFSRSPTVAEIAQACGRRDEEVLAALEAGQGYSASSLDGPNDDDHGAVAMSASTTAADPDVEIWEHFAKLSGRERDVVQLRFVEQLSQSEIANRLGISQMQVSRILRQALDDLRASFRDTE